MNWLKHLFQHIWAGLTSPKAVAIEQQIEQLVVSAQPIVQMIAMMVPNRTLEQITKAYATYAIPLVTQVANDPTSIGNAMRDLATAILRKNHQDAAASTLNTAVELAVVGMKIVLATTPPPA